MSRGLGSRRAERAARGVRGYTNLLYTNVGY